MKDWLAWHESYADPTSSIARRLPVVQERLAEMLLRSGVTSGRGRRLLSLCAGDGRDVIPVLSTRADRSAISAVLVERDGELARRAAEAARTAGLESVEVRCGDAGDPASFIDVLPVDVLLLCGILGNIEHERVKDVVDLVPCLLAENGYVIWTRGGSEPDRRPEIRRWFLDAGLIEVSFDGAPEAFGVGVNRLAVGPSDSPRQLPDRVFTFEQR